MINIPIISFNAGELSPLIDARTDIDKYSSGCRTLQNMLPRIYGNAERRPGTKYIVSTKETEGLAEGEDSSKVIKMVSFQYSDAIAYQMEFGPNYIRYYSGGARVVGSAAPSDWATATDYIMGQFALYEGIIYRCIVAHTSSTEAGDGEGGEPDTNSTEWVTADIASATAGWLGVDESNIHSKCGERSSSYSLGNALDGTERWLHDTNHTHWFILDLKQRYNITKVKGRSNSGRDPIDVDIYVTDDISDWGVAVADNITSWQNTTDWVEENITATVGQYIKVEMIDTENVFHLLSFGSGPDNSFPIFDVYGSLVEPICETPTSYLEDELFELQFRQIADVVRIIHNNHAPQKLTRTSVTTFDLTTIDFNKGPFLKRNDLANDDDITITPSAITGDITLTASSAIFDSSHIGALFKITQPRAITETSGEGTSTGIIGDEIPIKGVFTLNIHDQWTGTVELQRNKNDEDWETYRTYVSADDKHVAQTFTEEEDNVKYRINCTSYGVDDAGGGTIAADITVEDSTQSGIARITGIIGDEGMEASATVLVDFANRAADDLGTATLGATAALTKNSGTHITWSGTAANANDNDYSTKVGFYGTSGHGVAVGNYDVVITLAAASRVTGIEYYRYWKMGSFEPSGYEKVYVYYGGAYHLVKTINYTGGGSGTGLVKVTDGAPWSDVTKVKIVVEMGSGAFRTWDAEAYHYLYELTVWAVAEADVVADGLPANPSKRWYEGAWSNKRGYPSTMVFFEERTCYAGSKYQPQTVWLSESGNYDNFEEGTDDADSFWKTLSSDKRNSIRWIAALEALVLGTNGGEWRIRATADDEEITQKNFNARQQTPWGSKKIQPLKVGDAILFVDSVGRKIRELTFSDYKQKFVAPDLSALAEHITLSGITCIDYQKNPDSIVWCVLDDGSLLSMTYERDQNVIAWAKHPIGGTDVVVESVSVIPGDDEDEVWISVARTINSVTVRYIEQLQPREDIDLEDSWFLDSGLNFDGGDAVTIENVESDDGTTTVTTDGNHGFDDGDIVYITGIVGMTELNGRYFVVTDSTEDTFKIRTVREVSPSPSPS